MVTLEKIKSDLNDIKFYYANKDRFEHLYKTLGENEYPALAKKYNQAVRTAPAKLYLVYGCLYIDGYTQDITAEELGFTPEYIRVITKQLFEFLQENI